MTAALRRQKLAVTAKIRAASGVMGCMRIASLVAISAFCMLFSAASASGARADTPVTAERPPVRRWFTLDDERDSGILSLGAGAMSMSLPRFAVVGDTVQHRMVGVAAPPNASWFYGGRAGLTARRGSLVVEVVEVSYMQTAGGSSLSAQADGQTVAVTRDAMHKLDFALMGAGVQAITPSGKAKLGLKFGWGVSSIWSSAHVTGGGVPASDGLSGDLHGFARLELAGCVRSTWSLMDDNRTWGCLTAGTNIYEEGWWNGVAVGLRVDL